LPPSRRWSSNCMLQRERTKLVIIFKY
jgi:hypothetical protein